MRLPYYPGCTLKTTAKNFDESTVTSARALDIDLVELPRWNCCGTVHSLARDDVMHYLAPIRNLIRVEEMVREEAVDEGRVVTLCAMCYNTLKRANEVVREDAEKMEKVRGIMERETPYEGEVEVVHLLEILREMGWSKVADRVENPLGRLRVAPYYGCLLLRPRGYGIDDVDDPQIMESLLEALGAEVVDIPFKTKCCGAYHTVQMKEVVAELSHRILEQAVEAGADMIVTACPLCEYNLGPRHEEVKRLFRDFESIPVVYFTQLMSLAFGLGED
ncbi:MAG: CoB--CoM heterodisulfide reductase iron-sulfur subunit B family protein, partial [Candidatus Bathyarchaeia archaeon]